MSITKHIPDHSPGPTGSAFLGYPLGVWPQAHSAFCADHSPSNTRHSDCSVPGCTCLCHANPYSAGGVERVRLRKEAKVKAIDELKEESLETIDTLERMDRLGTNRDSTRVSFRKLP
jgi:hypothetical protein